MTQIHWTKSVSADFGVAADWTGGVVPGGGDDAILDAAGSLFTVTASTSETVNGIQTAANATLVIAGGTFTATDGTDGGANAGQIVLAQNTEFVVDGVIDNEGGITLQAANNGNTITSMDAGSSTKTTFAGGGVITMKTNGIYDPRITGRYIDNYNNTITGGIFIFEPGAGAYFRNDAHGVVVNNTGSGLIESLSICNYGVINNSSGVFLEIVAGNLVNAGLIESTLGHELEIQARTLINTGKIATAGSGELYFRGVTITNLKGGTIDSSNMLMNGGAVSGGALVLAASATLTAEHYVSLATNLTNNGTISVRNSYDGVTLDASSHPIVNTGLIEITSGDSSKLVLQNGTVANSGHIVNGMETSISLINVTVNDSAGGALDPGQALTLTNSAILGGALTLAAGGVITAKGVDTLATALTNNGTIKVTDGASLGLQGAIVNGGTIGLASAGTATTLAIGGGGANLTGGGVVALGSANVIITGVGGAQSLINLDNTIMGVGQIGAGALILANRAQGMIANKSAGVLTIDTGANTIANAGLIEAFSNTNVSVVIQSAISNTGRLEVYGGSMTVNAAVSGGGLGVIAGGYLYFTASFNERVQFLRPTGTLGFYQSQTYTGAIFHFSKTGGTALDLRDIAYVGAGEATYSGTTAKGVLTVSDGTHTARITLVGDYTASNFTVSFDGNGGTIVVASAHGGAHPFIAAAASLGGASAGSSTMAHDARPPHPPTLTQPGPMIA